MVKSNGHSSFEEYYRTVVDDDSGGKLLELIDRISTNHSYFFREADHFDFLRTAALPSLLELERIKDTQTLRIWCAGCAGGEEPYTLAMVLADFLEPEYDTWDIGVLATDISTSALQQARKGEYAQQKIAGVPAEYRKYLRRLDNDHYEIVDKIKKPILFKRLNLMREDYPFKGKFDIIFCRNVMIYFDQNTRKGLLSRFHRYLHPSGYLFIGHSETLGRGTGLFRYLMPTVYTSQ